MTVPTAVHLASCASRRSGWWQRLSRLAETAIGGCPFQARDRPRLASSGFDLVHRSGACTIGTTSEPRSHTLATLSLSSSRARSALVSFPVKTEQERWPRAVYRVCHGCKSYIERQSYAPESRHNRRLLKRVPRSTTHSPSPKSLRFQSLRRPSTHSAVSILRVWTRSCDRSTSSYGISSLQLP